MSQTTVTMYRMRIVVVFGGGGMVLDGRIGLSSLEAGEGRGEFLSCSYCLT